MSDPISFNSSIRNDPDTEVQSLFKAAESRKQAMLRYHLLDEAMKGNVIDITQSPVLFEALNKEKMDFEEILKLHPDEVKELRAYVKERKAEQGGRWYNPESEAWWGEKGVIPPCCYHARPTAYWKNKKLVNSFLNTFNCFKIAEGKL